MRFPIVDKVTGTSDVPVETPDTVAAAERPVLEVANLTTRFPIRSGLFGKVSGRVHAVENISFHVHAGETLALVGEFGCGKSTTGRSILKLVEPDSGSVRVDGEDVLGMEPRALRDIAQAHADHLPGSVREPQSAHVGRLCDRRAAACPRARVVVAGTREGCRSAGSCRADARHGDRAFRTSFPVVSASASASPARSRLGPSSSIADEAVSALDVSVKAQVVNLMLDLQASMGLAYLFISHDIAVVERMSHRVAVMYLGEIVEIGPRAAVFGNPQHPYTKKLHGGRADRRSCAPRRKARRVE